jgi:hypothetical protein
MAVNHTPDGFSGKLAGKMQINGNVTVALLNVFLFHLFSQWSNYFHAHDRYGCRFRATFFVYAEQMTRERFQTSQCLCSSRLG